MKKIVAILIVLVAIVIIVVVSMKGNDPIETFDDPANFTFEQNLQIRSDEEVEVFIAVNVDDVAKMEVRFNDSVVATFVKPKKEASFLLQGTDLVGAKQLSLVTTLNDGSEYSDDRLVRVLSDIKPIKLKAEIVKQYPHDINSFTQGLEFYNGKLYESTGLNGQSAVFEVDLASGNINNAMKMGLDATHFGEGITILNDVIYQLTWQNQKCITYDLGTSIVPKSEFSYNGEGWGACNDGKSIIMSNGTERLVFRNPETFMVERTIEVYNHVGPQIALNELEYIDGLIYANVWMTNRIVAIDPATGKILQEIDAKDLLVKGQGPSQDVLNGIAHNPQDKKTYLTGKKWLALFEVKFVKR